MITTGKTDQGALATEFALGIIAGEGSFYVTFAKDDRRRYGVTPGLRFQVRMGQFRSHFFRRSKTISNWGASRRMRRDTTGPSVRGLSVMPSATTSMPISRHTIPCSKTPRSIAPMSAGNGHYRSSSPGFDPRKTSYSSWRNFITQSMDCQAEARERPRRSAV